MPLSSQKKLLFSSLAVLMVTTCSELGARLVNAPECKPIQPDAGDWETMIGDAELLWALEPNRSFQTGPELTRINELGLREQSLPKPKQPHERRIVVTGDSSIYGWGVTDNETYAVQLERQLNARFPEHIEVINLGVPGYSTEQTIRLLNKIGWQYEPDLLIVSNIFSDCNIDAFQDRTAMQMSSAPEGFRGLLHQSRLYCSIYMPWVTWQSTLNQNPNRVFMPGIPVGANAAVTLEELNTTLSLSRVPIPQYLENLEVIKNEAQSRGAQMMLAPLAQEWDAGLWNVPMPKPAADHVLPWQPYRTAQKQWADKHNIKVISFPDVFASYNGDKRGLFVDNMHPSRQGHIIMAQAVAEQLIRNPEMLRLSPSQRHSPR